MVSGVVLILFDWLDIYGFTEMTAQVSVSVSTGVRTVFAVTRTW